MALAMMSFHRHSVRFPVTYRSEVGEARRRALLLARSLGLPTTELSNLGIFGNQGWVCCLAIDKPDQALNPEGFFGISTVYKNLRRRSFCQHAVHLKQAFEVEGHDAFRNLDSAESLGL